MSKMQREKGKRGEREVAELLRAHGFEGRRGRQFKGTPDSPDVVGLPGLHIEVKLREALNVYAAYAEARAECDESSVPIVFHRRNRTRWLVTLDAEEFLWLLSKHSPRSTGNEPLDTIPCRGILPT